MATHPITLRFKESLARVYLDFCEILPRFRGSAIASLQRIREWQRKDAARAETAAKRPDGTEIVYDHLILVELFPIEDYDRMEHGLRTLFPPESFGSDPIADFKKTALQLSLFGHTLVGYIVPKRNPFLGFRSRILTTLPSEVDRIVVRLHKILPSAFAVTLGIALGDRVTQQLRTIQSNCYLPRVVFRNWIPWGLNATSHTMWSAEQARQQAIVTRLIAMRESIEAALKPFVSGYFSTTNHGHSSKLLSIPCFTLKGVPTDDVKFREWLDRASGWLSDLGPRSYEIDRDGFKSKDALLLIRPSEIDSSARPCFLIEPNGTADLAEHQSLRLESMLDNALPFLVFGEFLNRTQATIEALRKRVYEKLADTPRIRWLRSNFELNRELQRESMLVARFGTEITQSENILKHQARSLNEFQSVVLPSKTGHLS